MIRRVARDRTGILSVIAAISGLGGFVAIDADWGPPAPKHSNVSASKILNSRFPSEWAETVAPESVTLVSASSDTNLVSASADINLHLIDPNPIYPLPAAKEASISDAASVDQSDPKVAQQAATSPIAPKLAVKRSNAVLSDRQIASIKRRLKAYSQAKRLLARGGRRITEDGI